MTRRDIDPDLVRVLDWLGVDKGHVTDAWTANAPALDEGLIDVFWAGLGNRPVKPTRPDFTGDRVTMNLRGFADRDWTVNATLTLEEYDSARDEAGS